MWHLLINTCLIIWIILYYAVTVWFPSGVSAPSHWAAKIETLLPSSQGLVTLDMLLVCVFVTVYILCVSVCVCVSVCAPTGLKGGALCGHAPRAGAAALGHHDGELVQRVGLQTRHHVAEVGGVGHLWRDTRHKDSACLMADYIHWTLMRSKVFRQHHFKHILYIFFLQSISVLIICFVYKMAEKCGKYPSLCLVFSD